MNKGQCGLLAVAMAWLVMLPAGAAAQLDITGLPGDPPGEKRPFQRVAQKTLSSGELFWIEEISLPACATHLTVETITVLVATSSAYVPKVVLSIAQNGIYTGHIIALIPTGSTPGLVSYNATHAVRWHHDASLGKRPLLIFEHFGGAAEFQVSIAGYTTGLCRRAPTEGG